MPQGNRPADLIQRNDDGTLTKETVKRAIKAFRRRLKLTREEDENRLGHDAMTSGRKSSIVGIKPPEQYPPEVWDELVERGRLRNLGDGVYELVEVQPRGLSAPLRRPGGTKARRGRAPTRS